MDLASFDLWRFGEPPTIQIVSPDATRARVSDQQANTLAELIRTRVRSTIRAGGGWSGAKGTLAPTLRIYLTERAQEMPFLVDYIDEITITTRQSEGICLYTAMNFEDYLFLWSLMGLVQWRTLALNDLMRVEDFQHDTPTTCLFSKPGLFSEIALRLESPHVCEGCFDFYHCLGADLEVLALRQAIEDLNTVSRVSP